MNIPFLSRINNPYKNADERLVRESDKLLFKAYIIMQILAILIVINMIFDRDPWFAFLGCAFIILGINSFVYINLKKACLGLKDIFSKQDECISEIKNKIFRKGYYLALYTILDLNLIVVIVLNFAIKNNMIRTNLILEAGSTFLIVMIPAFYFTVVAIKKGLLISKFNKRNKITNKKTNLKNFKFKCAKASVFFGLIMGGLALTHENILGAIKTGIIAGLMWGILFYILMRLMIKFSERNADKNL